MLTSLLENKGSFDQLQLEASPFKVGGYEAYKFLQAFKVQGRASVSNGEGYLQFLS